MGKISPVSAKYIIHAHISIDGVVDRPDVIGSVFGQTEGLLGSDLELRELQRSGRVGRIEVDIHVKNGKTEGEINIPSSMDKTETALIGASLETIQRIGPCNARVKVERLEDIRTSKRGVVIDRAKELLNTLTHTVLPDSRDIKEEVADSVRMMDVGEYGKDRLPAGPDIDQEKEIIVVEGRADVLNLLKSDIKNVIALNGTSVPQTIIDLAKEKTITLFVDGDRGGNLIIRELTSVAKIGGVCKAPDGKEVEELTQKEIHQALRAKMTVEEALQEMNRGGNGRRSMGDHAPMRSFEQRSFERPFDRRRSSHRDYEYRDRPHRGRMSRHDGGFSPRGRREGGRGHVSNEERETFKTMLSDLIGSHGAYILDEKLNIMGKVPLSELENTVRDLEDAKIIVVDGAVTKEIVSVAERARLKYVVAESSEIRPEDSRVRIVTSRDL